MARRLLIDCHCISDQELSTLLRVSPDSRDEGHIVSDTLACGNDLSGLRQNGYIKIQYSQYMEVWQKSNDMYSTEKEVVGRYCAGTSSLAVNDSTAVISTSLLESEIPFSIFLREGSAIMTCKTKSAG